jgi:hypothetical protein
VADLNDLADPEFAEAIMQATQQPLWRRLGAALLLLASAMLGGCEESSGVGFSVGLPASYGSMELGMATSNWSSGPFWNN